MAIKKLAATFYDQKSYTGLRNIFLFIQTRQGRRQIIEITLFAFFLHEKKTLE